MTFCFVLCYVYDRDLVSSLKKGTSFLNEVHNMDEFFTFFNFFPQGSRRSPIIREDVLCSVYDRDLVSSLKKGTSFLNKVHNMDELLK